jgi:magnesium transporter
MIRILHYTKSKGYHADVTVDELAAVLQKQEGFVWVDMVGEPSTASEVILRDTFTFHPLAVDDALNEIHLPKLDDWEEYLYIVLHDVVYDELSRRPVSTLELDIFLGRNYIVTSHHEPVIAVDRVWESCQRDQRFLKNGPDHLLYRIADELVEDYFAVIDKMEEELNLIEDRLFSGPNRITLSYIFTLKRMLLQLRRVIGPQREVINKLARDDFAVIDAKDRVYFRDVYDHMIRLYDLMESLRDLVTGALETYLSVVNNRMNDIMKTLTVITTLFMPLTFITGFFGMNFFQATIPLEFWTGRAVFTLTLLLMILTPLVMFWWMRRRAWM